MLKKRLHPQQKKADVLLLQRRFATCALPLNPAAKLLLDAA
jgi:hypothetical protein